jgi:hypothetical protein
VLVHGEKTTMEQFKTHLVDRSRKEWAEKVAIFAPPNVTEEVRKKKKNRS